MSFGLAARTLTIITGAVNIADIALHAAIDDIEPLRVAGNVVVIISTVLLILRSPSRRPIVPVLAAAVSFGLNLVFIVMEGIGPLGAVLITATSLLLLATAFAMRSRNR